MIHTRLRCDLARTSRLCDSSVLLVTGHPTGTSVFVNAGVYLSTPCASQCHWYPEDMETRTELDGQIIYLSGVKSSSSPVGTGQYSQRWRDLQLSGHVLLYLCDLWKVTHWVGGFSPQDFCVNADLLERLSSPRLQVLFTLTPLPTAVSPAIPCLL